MAFSTTKTCKTGNATQPEQSIAKKAVAHGDSASQNS
jgi:hypothetical protein